MQYMVLAESDSGNRRKDNQDSLCIELANTQKYGMVVMALVCDGMGGLSDGEIASAKVVKYFADWFKQEFPQILEQFSWDSVIKIWEENIKALNYKIQRYGEKHNIQLGTTLSMILIIGGQYLIAHVGDTRIYRISEKTELLTEDQTYIAREIRNGNMTREEAENHPKRNMLLQCIGASTVVSPQMITGTVEAGTVIMICSDGFRHKVTKEEIFEYFNYEAVSDKNKMRRNMRYVIDIVKKRKEQDNISVLLIRISEE